MSTTTNFFEALANHKEPKKQEIFFRVYYDKKTGKILHYSMEDLPDLEYITITKEQFAECNPNLYVKDGELKKRKMLSFGKMRPSPTGTPVYPTDITLVDPESKVYWEFHTCEDD